MRKGTPTCKSNCLRWPNGSINFTPPGIVVFQKNHSYIDLVMSLTPWGMKTGRDAVIKLLTLIGSPQNALKVFHVTGSNGKWSVCQMISQILSQQFHKKVGLFTSPHLIDITERFQINWVPISTSKLNTYYKKVINLANKYTVELSFFEIQVVAMVLYFTDEKVDYAVIEVGLGGLYDGTNIFKHPVACFITSITLEHTHVLGKTRHSILKNKLGIVKKWTTLYTHLKNKQITEYCHKHCVQLIQPKNSPNHKLTNLPGKHQQKNALLVLQSLEDLWFEQDKIRAWLHDIHNPGRFEWITNNILVDTANNKENIKLLLDTIQKNSELQTPNSELTLIFGTTQVDLLYVSQLANMFPYQRKIAVDGFCERALPCSSYNWNVHFDSIWHLDTEDGQESMKKIFQQEKKSQKYIICGSIYLVGYAMRLSRYSPFAKR